MAVAIWDISVARRSDHAARCRQLRWGTGVGDDGVTLMSAGMFPRLEGGIRAALNEADSLYIFSFSDRTHQ